MRGGVFLANMACVALVVLATAVLMLVAMGGSDGSGLAALGFLAWAVSPFAFLAVLAWLVRGWRAASFLVLAAVVALGAWGLYSYYDGVFAHPDPQSGLYFVLMPALQWVGATLTGLAALVAVLIARRKRRGAAP